MKRFRIVPASVSLIALMAAACGTDAPTATSPDAAFARGGRAVGYTSVDIGALLPGYSSVANGVNDAGDVAGISCCGAGSGAFATVAGAVTSLGGDGSAGLGISNGTPVYVVGYVGAPSQPVRWTIGGGPTFLTLLAGETYGAAHGVNDVGEAVGNAGSSAVMWATDGTPTSVPAPAGFVSGEGRGINNAGHAVFVFLAPGSSWEGARGYLRLPSGVLIELPPESGDVTTFANDISEVANGAVYIAGTTRTSLYVFRSVRWQVDAATGQILATDVRPESSHGLAVSNTGAVAGFLEANASRTPRLDAYLWRGAELLQLKPPKSGKDGRAWAESQSGQFVAGEAAFALTRHAVLWTISSP